ncbi:alpha/beta hydrolase [Sphingomonas sp.]|uniref:alpha/beta fold hydrolase n=1 Tax=Sphingomonas sp. TaxID=28214 RepID=UPI00185D054F|nr:alpha/beta hydrolase [Sphingomonas sp.]MBA3510568.1 alpha/beta hydrolase [Sphingomonas sp.]
MPNDSHPAPGKAAEWKARTWTSRDGLELYFRDYPGSDERPPLLCLHGLTRNSRDFEAFAGRYAGRFRVIAVDFRGRGMSQHDPQPGRYTPVTYAADVLQLLDELEIDRALFVGTSLGGLVTMLVAGMQPQRIAGAILNDVGPELDDRGLDRIRSYVGKQRRFANWDEAAGYVAGINRNLPASNGPDDWVRAARRVCREDGDAIVFDYDMAIAEPFTRPKREGGAEFDMWPLYRRLGRVPLLIVRGESSDLLSRTSAKAMLDAAPGAQLVTVPGVGHAPELSEPAAVAAIDDFLARFTG